MRWIALAGLAASLGFASLAMLQPWSAPIIHTDAGSLLDLVWVFELACFAVIAVAMIAGARRSYHPHVAASLTTYTSVVATLCTAWFVVQVHHVDKHAEVAPAAWAGLFGFMAATIASGTLLAEGYRKKSRASDDLLV
jgi:hypothetical protein